MDRIRAMQAFVRIVETGSFSRVATEFHTGQSTISKWLSALEAHLGGRLLNRNSRQLQLTTAGSDYYEQCRRILDAIDAAENQISAQISEPRGNLTISIPTVFGRLYVLPFLKEFSRQYPAIDFVIHMDDRNVDLIAEGVDLAIRTTPLKDSSLVAQTLADYQRVLVAAPAYLDRHPAPHKPDDLRQHNCMQHTLIKQHHEWHFYQGERLYKVPVQGSIRSNNGDALLQLALEGLGVCVLPRWFVASALEEGRLIPLLCNYRLAGKKIHAVYPRRQYLPGAVKLFLQTFHDYLQTRMQIL